MMDALGTRVANRLLIDFLATAVATAGIGVRRFGAGWPSLPGGTPGDSVVTVERQREVAASARIVLHAEVTGQVGATALLAAGSGAVLLARSHPHDQAPGGLATLLSPDTEFLPFRLASEAVRRVRELLARPDFRQGIAAAEHRFEEKTLAGIGESWNESLRETINNLPEDALNAALNHR
jgi:hypothetical protein